MKPATVRFYFDADILGLGKLIAGLRNDCTYPGDPGGVVRRRQRPACSITTPATDDLVWIPQVTAARMLIITRDSAIQRRVAELNTVRDSGARMVALSGAEAVGTWAQLEVVMSQWRRIEALLAVPGPFVYSVSRTGGLTRVSLPPS